jgi:NADH-quinone oxidoreductase subunit H
MNWNVFYQPLSFLIFLICALQKPIEPFDLAECETELMVDTIRSTPHENGFYVLLEYANMFISSFLLFYSSVAITTQE